MSNKPPQETGQKALSLASLFSADRPITSPEEDLLERSAFVSAVAEALRGWSQKDSLVVALYGKWGAGKSSLKNLIVAALKTPPDSAESGTPVVIDFNPWTFGAQASLSGAFFREVGLAIGRKTEVDKTFRTIGQKFQALSQHLQTTSTLLAALYPLILSVVGATFVACGLSAIVQTVHRATSTWLAVGVGGLFTFLAVARNVVEQVGKSLLAHAVTLEKTQAEHKADLDKELRKSRRTIVIVMDDVDRLTPDETWELIRLVKSNADFPNIVYLLLCQRETLERVVEQKAPTLGREFLEKIVQVCFTVPTVERAAVESVLFKRLDLILEHLADSRRFDSDRWGSVFMGGLREYFGNLRDVNRFAGSLAFSAGLFRNGGAYEVNVIDLIVLDAFRIFEPPLYEALPSYRAVLTERSSDLLKTDERRKAAIPTLLELVPEQRRDRVKTLLADVFPRAARELGASVRFDDEEGWTRDLRAGVPACFDRYFQFALPSKEVGQADIEALQNAQTASEHALVWQSLVDRGLRDAMLDRLEAYKQQWDLTKAVPFLTALFEIGDDLPERGTSPDFFDLGPTVHAQRFVHFYLKQEVDESKRETILRESVSATKGLYLPVAVMSWETRREEEKGKDHDYLLTEEAARGLQELCVSKIRAAAGDGRLLQLRGRLDILFRWREWASESEPRDWMAERAADAKSVIPVLASFVRPTYSTGFDEYGTKVSWSFRLRSARDLLDLDPIEARIKAGELVPSDDKTDPIRLLLEALDRERSGKRDPMED